jgi:hypothetical protein
VVLIPAPKSFSVRFFSSVSVFAGTVPTLLNLKSLSFKNLRTCVSPLFIPVKVSIFEAASDMDLGGFSSKYFSMAVEYSFKSLSGW